MILAQVPSSGCSPIVCTVERMVIGRRVQSSGGSATSSMWSLHMDSLNFLELPHSVAASGGIGQHTGD